jgi:hypothetical protein
MIASLSPKIDLLLRQQGLDTTTPAGGDVSDDGRLCRIRAGHDCKTSRP